MRRGHDREVKIREDVRIEKGKWISYDNIRKGEERHKRRGYDRENCRLSTPPVFFSSIPLLTSSIHIFPSSQQSNHSNGLIFSLPSSIPSCIPPFYPILFSVTIILFHSFLYFFVFLPNFFVSYPILSSFYPKFPNPINPRPS